MQSLPGLNGNWGSSKTLLEQKIIPQKYKRNFFFFPPNTLSGNSHQDLCDIAQSHPVNITTSACARPSIISMRCCKETSMYSARGLTVHSKTSRDPQLSCVHANSDAFSPARGLAGYREQQMHVKLKQPHHPQKVCARRGLLLLTHTAGEGGERDACHKKREIRTSWDKRRVFRNSGCFQKL